MIIIIFTLIGLAVGYAIASRHQKKETPLPREFPHKIYTPPASPLPPDSSCLEDKMWYEAELDFLFKFNEKLSSNLTFEDTVRFIAEAAHNFLPVERTVLLMWDKDLQNLTLAHSIGWNNAPNGGFFVIGKNSISGYVVGNRNVLLVSDLTREEHLNKMNKEEYLQKTFISAPIIYKDEVLGVLHVCDKRASGPFTQREASVVMNIVRMGAIALQNVRLYEQASKRAAELKIAYDELKEMQDKLIQSEKLKAIGQLASGVAHEIRNPLGIIMQGVAYLEQIISPEEKEPHETLSMVKESVERADKIVISLLDFSRATKLELHPENIGSILEDSLDLVKKELKNIQVVREIREGLPKVLVDKNKLTQVFINLFVNAVHAMPEGGKLTIRSFLKDAFFEPGEKAVVVEIEDTGTGISEENLKKIFNPFFTTKGQGKGTGLGLSVTQNIISMHKGLIEVKSQVNKGTMVIITLRISKE